MKEDSKLVTWLLTLGCLALILLLIPIFWLPNEDLSPATKTRPAVLTDQDSIAKRPATPEQEQALATNQLEQLMDSIEEAGAISLDDNSSSQILLIGKTSHDQAKSEDAGDASNYHAGSSAAIEQLIDNAENGAKGKASDFEKVAAEGLNQMINQEQAPSTKVSDQTNQSAKVNIQADQAVNAPIASVATTSSPYRRATFNDDDRAYPTSFSDDTRDFQTRSAAVTTTAAAANTTTTSKSIISHMPSHCWRVQLGTFAKTDNAYALEKRLTQSGYVALIRYQNQYARVLVGELASRSEALKLKQELAEQFHIKGVVVQDVLESF